MESESPEEQVLKPNDVQSQEYIDPQKSQSILRKTLSRLGFGKEGDNSTQDKSLTTVESSGPDSFMQPPDKETIDSEDATKLEETRKKLHQETKTPTWVQRKDEGLLKGKITSKPLS